VVTTLDAPIIYAERFCGVCQSTWLRQVDRVDRMMATRPSTCPDCRERDRRRVVIARAFMRLVRPVARQPEALLDGLCQQVDPEMFYPAKYESSKEAKRVCGMCPVQAECLAYALRAKEMHGVWGGKSERERAKMLTDARRVTA
jgi:WhiB family redox-sensing transcriptional regulator